MGELDHRVRNMLAVVSSVVAQTLRASATPEAFAADIQGRIKAIADAHGLLAQAGQDTLPLRDIVTAELAPHERGTGSLSVTGPDFDLTSRAGLALAMAIHELATNAVKYGALSVPAGRLDVAWTEGGDAEHRTLNFAWTESGGPPVKPPTRRGFGTALIERVLADELGTTVTREFPESGLRCTIVLPLTGQVGRLRPVNEAGP